MINIKYTKNSISIAGHACQAKKGQDIVCAATSGIFFGAALGWFKKNETRMYVECGNGLKLELVKKTKANQLLIELLVKQLTILARNKKKYIKITKG